MGRAVDQRAQVLRQAGSSKSESGLQIRRRAVELDVLAQRGHHFAAIHAHLLAERPDFVGESNFHRMKGIAGVLDHLRRAQRYQSSLHARGRYKSATVCSRRRIVAANHQQRWLEEIPNRRAFAQKLGMRHHAHRRIVSQRRAAPAARRSREKRYSECRQSAASGAAEDVRRSPQPPGAIGAVPNCRSFPTAYRHKPIQCPLQRWRRPRWKPTACPPGCFPGPDLPAQVRRRARARFQLLLLCVRSRSIPKTRCPRLARQAAVTHPT